MGGTTHYEPLTVLQVTSHAAMREQTFQMMRAKMTTSSTWLQVSSLMCVSEFSAVKAIVPRNIDNPEGHTCQFYTQSQQPFCFYMSSPRFTTSLAELIAIVELLLLVGISKNGIDISHRCSGQSKLQVVL